MADLLVDYRPDLHTTGAEVDNQKLCKWLSKSSYITSERTTLQFLCIELPNTVSTIQIFSPLKVSVKENKEPTEKNSSRASIFATKASYISN